MRYIVLFFFFFSVHIISIGQKKKQNYAFFDTYMNDMLVFLRRIYDTSSDNNDDMNTQNTNISLGNISIDNEINNEEENEEKEIEKTSNYGLRILDRLEVIQNDVNIVFFLLRCSECKKKRYIHFFQHRNGLHNSCTHNCMQKKDHILS